MKTAAVQVSYRNAHPAIHRQIDLSGVLGDAKFGYGHAHLLFLDLGPEPQKGDSVAPAVAFWAALAARQKRVSALPPPKHSPASTFGVLRNLPVGQ